MKEQIDKSIGKSMEEETIEATTKGGAAAEQPKHTGSSKWANYDTETYDAKKPAKEAHGGVELLHHGNGDCR